jgi:TRAP-type C4-dicarboxylate transport system permease small subunit
VFLGIAYAYNEGGYIRVSFLSDRLPPSIKIGIKYLVQFFSAGLTFILVFATGHQALKIFARRETLQVVDIPLWPAYAIVPLGLLLVSLRMFIDSTKIGTDRSSLFKEEATSA